MSGNRWQPGWQDRWQPGWQDDQTRSSGPRWEHQEREPTERPSSSATGRPPKQRQQFFGNLSQITKQALVAAVQDVQRSNILGDSLWKCWVEQFGAKHNDPNKYDVGFLEDFVHSCEGVMFCKEEHSKLAAAIVDGSVKRIRLTEDFPAAVRASDRAAGGSSAPAASGAAEASSSPAASSAAGASSAAAPATVAAPDAAAEQAAPPTVSVVVDATVAATNASMQTDDCRISETIDVRTMMCIPVKVQRPLGRIPKYIFVSAPSYDNVDQWYKTHWDSLQQRASGWTLCFVDDKAMCAMIDEECTPREARAFKALNPLYGPARADFLRYHLMRSRGGLWLDGKSGFTGELEKNLAKWQPLPPLIFGHWGWPNQTEEIPEDVHKKGEIQQWFLLSAPRHPLWDVVLADVVDNIENYDAKVDGVGKQAVLKLTGPITLSRSLYPLLSHYPHLHVKDKDLGMLYDCLGGHQNKQKMLGPGSHYSKLKVPIVLYKIGHDPPAALLWPECITAS